MELRMHRYFKKNENIVKVKKYLAECSVGDWFVLYQMSKNMNKRLFFDFLTSLAQVSRSEILQVGLISEMMNPNLTLLSDSFKWPLRSEQCRRSRGV